MTIKRATLVKAIVFTILLLYLLTFRNVNTMTFDASVALAMSFYWLKKNKDSNLLFIMTLFIFYCIYSITMGEYFFKDSLGVPMMEVNVADIYGVAIRILMVFVFILTMFVDKPSKNSIKMRYKDNSFIYYVLVVVLGLVGLLGVNRNVGSSYVVNTTPIYEYSSILFLFAYYSSGNKKNKKIFISLTLFTFVLQDFYLGGRITALQLMIVFLFCMLDELLNSKTIFAGAIGGIVVNVVVGVYRSTYSFSGLSIVNILNELIRKKFVFDTATYSYYASATHIASVRKGSASLAIRLTSFWEFIKSIVTGSENPISNVTRFVSDNYYTNIGGGVIPSHFYFWLGWIGVILSAFFVVVMLNKMMKSNSDFALLSLTTVAVTAPRWFLYNPLLLFRAQFILGALFILYSIGNKMLFKIAGKKKYSFQNTTNS